jgi:hypothetical protein
MRPRKRGKRSGPEGKMLGTASKVGPGPNIALEASSVTPHKLECPAGEEEVHETHARHRHSLRRARRTSGG